MDLSKPTLSALSLLGIAAESCARPAAPPTTTNPWDLRLIERVPAVAWLDESKPGAYDRRRKITGNAPPGDATAWYVSIKDERGALASSEVTIR